MAKNNNGRKPRKKASPAKEWLSDNLRYILLVLLAAVIVLVIVVLYQSNRTELTAEDTSSQMAETTVIPTAEAEAEETAEATPKATKEAEKTEKKEAETTPSVTPTTTPEAETAPMESADEQIASLVENYFNVLSSRDGSQLANYVDSVTDEDIANVNNGGPIVSYSNFVVYSAAGPSPDTYVVIASYDYRYDGFDVDVPGLSQFYVYPRTDGSLCLASDVSDATVQEYIQNLLNTEEVQNSVQDVQQRYDAVMAEHPDLQAHIQSLNG